MVTEFTGTNRECKELLESYQNCFAVVSYDLNPIDIGLDRWSITIQYKKEE